MDTTAPAALHPLLARLVDRHGAQRIQLDTLEAFESAAGDAVLLFSGDPVRFPEALDVAVVLPELLASAGRPLRIGVVPREIEDAVARRWAVQRWPSLVFLRGGQYLGTLSGMQDWDVYQARLAEVLGAAPGRRPGIGIPLVGADSGPSCR
jgi:hydrogenase-1 operon protein HyaE